MNDYVMKTASLIHEQFPDLQKNIIDKADLAMKGMLILPGSGGKPVFVGNPPRWKEHAVPQGDIEAVYVLNRMEHWTVLLQAFALSGKGQYASKVVEELKDWLSNCPCPRIRQDDPDDLAVQFDSREPERAPWRSLEAGFRMFLSWYHIPLFLSGTEYLTEELKYCLSASVREHMEVLSRVSPLLYPNADHNHYLMENLGLLYAACEFGESVDEMGCNAGSRKASGWKVRAVREIKRCMERQVTDDGGQIEGCPHYHNECFVLFARAYLEAESHGIQMGREYEEKLRKALEYVWYSARPDGTNVPWGDSDASHAPVKSAFYASAALNEHDHFLMSEGLAGWECCMQVWQECLWDLGDIVKCKMPSGSQIHSLSTLLPLYSWQKALHQVCIRSSWENDALSLFFACRAPVQNAHAHMDPGSFDFCAYGRAITVDPGRYTYHETEERRLYKSAFSHQMLLVNGEEPFEYRSSWEYGQQSAGWVEWADGRAIQAVHRWNEHVIHRRRILAEFDRQIPFLAVIDTVTGLGEHDWVQLCYHMNFKQARKRENGIYLSDDYESAYGSNQITAMIVTTDDLAASFRTGFISEHMDEQRPSTIVDLREKEIWKTNEGAVGGEHDKEYNKGINKSVDDASVRFYAAVIIPLKPDMKCKAAVRLIQNEAGLTCVNITVGCDQYCIEIR